MNGRARPLGKTFGLVLGGIYGLLGAKLGSIVGHPR
jgi:hypothetical protein